MSVHASIRFAPPRALMRGLLVIVFVCGLLFGLGLLGPESRERSMGGLLMGFVHAVSITVAGGLFLAVLRLSNARWATALRRLPEALAASLPVLGFLALILIGGVPLLYDWSHESHVLGDPILEGKSDYLNWFAFGVRSIVFFLVWTWLMRGMVAHSRRQDADGDARHRAAMFKYAACFMPVLAVTYSLASVDWVESLEPHWFSTAFALVTLSGAACSALAACVLLGLWLRKRGELRRAFTDDHLDDLGKITIGFALFWGYIWFCQYMLVWYTNMPEETPYYALRLNGGWGHVAKLCILLCWAVPFFVLMPKRARRSAAVMGRVAVVVLVGQATHWYWLIGPVVIGEHPAFGMWDLAPVVGSLALLAWGVLRRLSEAPIVPLRDPALEESLHYHC
ncbi:MAG: hypothetical protein H6831_09035 [Planctomycetes bacterium]|nr:hypothetical protein [Planctomycetota bacterium]MCB9904536.1 hypothetical protein [Planctomycetota bacterium]